MEVDMAHAPRPLRLAAAATMAVAGVAMLVLPGPGLLTLLAAAHLVADDVPGLGEAMRRWLPARLAPPTAG
jgi:hypothetical protein